MNILDFVSEPLANNMMIIKYVDFPPLELKVHNKQKGGSSVITCLYVYTSNLVS